MAGMASLSISAASTDITGAIDRGKFSATLARADGRANVPVRFVLFPLKMSEVEAEVLLRIINCSFIFLQIDDGDH